MRIIKLASAVQTYKTEPRSKHFSSKMLVLATQWAAGGPTSPPLGNGKINLVKCLPKRYFSNANKDTLIHAFNRIRSTNV